MTDPIKAPFPWFGGKATIAPMVWERFGAVRNYVEPFFGSGAMLFGRPGGAESTETVNDADGYLANFWRAVKLDPEAVAEHADNPVNENDLHARHAWLVARREGVAAHLDGDPEWFDARMAGWWVWGLCCWIGSGWCSGKGPWIVEDGRLVDSRQRPHLGNAGQGINRQLPHLGNAGRGIHRKRPQITGPARGNAHNSETLEAKLDLFRQIAGRLHNVRVCCGDWLRVCGPSVTHKHGLTAVFLDPPYADTAKRADGLYSTDSLTVAHAVREWAIEQGKNKLMRISLCGYEGEHVMPSDWDCVAWKAKGGFAGQGDGSNVNSSKERIWFSPCCEKRKQEELFT